MHNYSHTQIYIYIYSEFYFNIFLQKYIKSILWKKEEVKVLIELIVKDSGVNYCDKLHGLFNNCLYVQFKLGHLLK